MNEILVNDFIKGLLIFLRISGVMFSAPIFSNKSIPSTIKVFFSLVIAYIVFFSVGDYKYDIDEGVLTLAIIGFKEVISGLIIGLMLNFVFQGIAYAGTLIGFDIGLAMARAFDPTSDMQTNVIGQALMFAAFLIFMIINGHHYIIRSLALSFEIIPLGYYTINESLFHLLVKYSSGIFVLAVKLASPIMVSFFLVHLASGIIARVIPQMNVFFVLQPLKMIIGFLLLISVTPIYVYFIKDLLLNYENKLLELIRIMST